MALLVHADYAQVRAALSPLIDEDMLPDDIIAMDVYQGVVEAQVSDRVADAATIALGSDALARRLRAAVALLIAARIAPVVQQVVMADQAGTVYRLQETDWLARAAELRSSAEELLNTFDDEIELSRPTFFTLAVGRRGR